MRARRSISAGTSRRTSGSPPVMRTPLTPTEQRMRVSRSISSYVSTSERPSHGRPSAGMQYLQRKLQRSVIEIRTDSMRRPNESTSGGRIGPGYWHPRIPAPGDAKRDAHP